MTNKFNIQLFAEGGASAGSTTTGSTSDANVSGAVAAGEDSREDVIYGKSSDLANHNGATTNAQVDKTKAFDDLIKKGGEYADEFSKRTQDIINKRFKETKNLEKQLASHQGIIQTLADKYGIEADDVEAIQKAIDSDESMFEEQAFKEGLTVKQYREKLELQRENDALRRAEQEAAARQHTEEIYANWMQEADNLAAKYGLNNFDMSSEMQNPDFTDLLASGVGFEAAYKAIHFDDMLGGAMAYTADKVREGLVNSVASRQSRVTEAGVDSTTSNVFKSDVNRWDNKDIDEVLRRVHSGDKIYL